MKKTLIILAFLLILIAIPATVYLSKKNQNLQQKAEALTVLSITPTTKQVTKDSDFTLNVDIDPSGNALIGTTLYIKFDKTYLQAKDITTTSYFKNITRGPTIDNDNGTIFVEMARPLNEANKTDSGTIATLSFHAVSVITQTTVSVDMDQTKVAAADADLSAGSTSALKSAQNSIVTIVLAANPSPTPSPSSNVSPSPSATPRVNPSPSPSSIPKISPTPAATPSNSKLKITLPADGATVTTNRPQFAGISNINTIISLMINTSPTTTLTTNSDSNGNWNYTATSDIPNGTYRVTLTDTQTAETYNINFTVKGTGGGTGGSDVTYYPTPTPTPSSKTTPKATPKSASSSAVPVTGTTTPTLILLFTAILIIIFGTTKFLPKL